MQLKLYIKDIFRAVAYGNVKLLAVNGYFVIAVKTFEFCGSVAVCFGFGVCNPSFVEKMMYHVVGRFFAQVKPKQSAAVIVFTGCHVSLWCKSCIAVGQIPVNYCFNRFVAEPNAVKLFDKLRLDFFILGAV